jgi:hypothetical protein
MKNILKMTTILLVSNCAIASYTAHIPLEITQAGSLPDGSIQFIDPANPTNPNPPTETENLNCYYNMTGDFSAHADGYIDGYYIVSRIYEGKEVINGSKGIVKDSSSGFDYAEICFGSEGPIFKIDNALDAGWDIDDCRYSENPLDPDNNYYWREVSGKNEYADRQAFTNAELGPRGSVTYQTTGLVFPVGYVNTDYGQIQPKNNGTIKRGSISFSRGSPAVHRPIEGGQEHLYAICKKTAK